MFSPLRALRSLRDRQELDMSKDYDPSGYAESGRADGSEQTDYAVRRNGVGSASGGHVADGGSFGGGSTRG